MKPGGSSPGEQPCDDSRLANRESSMSGSIRSIL
jgi:hypothetical protein